jgi:hypothetical protein
VSSRIRKSAVKKEAPQVQPSAAALTPGRLLYEFPTPLVKITQKHAPNVLDGAAAEIEIRRGHTNQNHSSVIGSWGPNLIGYRFLARLPSPSEAFGKRPADPENDPFWKGLGWYDPAVLDQAVAAADWSYTVTAGYCGWLLANSEFHRHHDAFFTRHQMAIRAISALPPLDDRQMTSSPAMGRCISSYTRLCRRWSLAGLAGPYLPVPFQPHFPVPGDQLQLLPAMARSAGTLLYFPRTHPLPDRDRLREMIEAAIARQLSPRHLKDWTDLIDSNNPGKKPIVRFERLFRLQHWWRLIHHRYGERIGGQIGNLQRAMGEFLLGDDPDDKFLDTVRKDLAYLNERLGSEWHTRPGALGLFV